VSVPAGNVCGASLPHVHYEHNDDFDEGEWADFMEFRLVYEGPLKAASRKNPRVKEKHVIRKQLHGQLSVFWDSHPQLRSMRYHVERIDPKMEYMRKLGGDFRDRGASAVETLARRFVRSNGFRFVPLVSKQYELICGLDILFLRRENPGDLLSQGGDIDNRIKTLFDALRIPSDGGELPSDEKPDAGEDPFFCLLENDSLVTDLKITTDRLLRPLGVGEHQNNVMLVVNVNVKASRINGQNLALL
jgi:hypothetical protein